MSADDKAQDTVDGFLGLKDKGHYSPRNLEIQDWGPGGPSDATCDSTDSIDIVSTLMRETNSSLWRCGLRKMLKVDTKFQLKVINFLKDFIRQSVHARKRGFDVRVDVDFDDIAKQVEHTDLQNICEGLNLKTSIAESGNTRQLEVRTGMNTTLISLEAFHSLLERISVLQSDTLVKLTTLDGSEGLQLYESQCCSHESQGKNIKKMTATFSDINSDDCKTVIKCLFATADTLVTYL
ncbi:hypothetical protein ACJMK2_005573 [Sinanodonta woodiana]|uniref:Uncharacterized protein n=1 Tax=Sinanodonta woodiana TaxID=1069815 RepID=A0ABD3VTZ6_SINWO